MKKCVSLLLLAVLVFTLCSCGSSPLSQEQIDKIVWVAETDLRPISDKYNVDHTVDVIPLEESPSAIISVDISGIEDRPIAERARIASELSKFEDYFPAQVDLPEGGKISVITTINGEYFFFDTKDSAWGDKITYREGDTPLIYEQTWDYISKKEEWNQ